MCSGRRPLLVKVVIIANVTWPLIGPPSSFRGRFHSNRGRPALVGLLLRWQRHLFRVNSAQDAVYFLLKCQNIYQTQYIRTNRATLANCRHQPETAATASRPPRQTTPPITTTLHSATPLPVERVFRSGRLLGDGRPRQKADQFQIWRIFGREILD